MTKPRCEYSRCKNPVTHRTEKLWERDPKNRVVHFCAAHVPSNEPSKWTGVQAYRSEPIT